MAETPDIPEDASEETAAVWLARLERGLTPGEQDSYFQWLSEDPRHGRALARLNRTWRALDVLGERHALYGARPNADLLAVAAPRRHNHWGYVSVGLAIAAAIIFVAVFRPEPSKAGLTVASTNAVRVITAPEKISLSDGSSVVLNGGKFHVAFTAQERRVHLLSGEAHFVVAKNPARPFIVDTGLVAVRAIGTAFDVVRADDSVEVLVTEGRVQVQRMGAASGPTAIVAGQRAFVDLEAANVPPAVTTLSDGDVDRALSWQSVRLEFAETPLSEVTAEFNLRNQHALVCGDADVGKLLVGGNFRADNVDAFVRLLEKSFGVTAQRREDGTTVLRAAK